MSNAQCDHPKESLEASLGIYFIGLVTDWRLWAIGLGLGMGLGMLTGALGVGQGWVGGAVGAPMGLWCAFNLGRVLRCGKCGKIVRFPLGKPPPLQPK